MCVVLIGVQCHPVASLIVAANRDEFYDRPAVPPGILSRVPLIIAGQDVRDGGTWLGMTSWGVAGLTNEPSGDRPARGRRSRGLLVLDVLRAGSKSEAVAHAEAAAPGHAPFHLFVADEDGGGVVNWDGERTTTDPITPGWHVLANATMDTPGSFKVLCARRLLEEIPKDGVEAVVRALQRVLSSHAKPERPPARPTWLPEQVRRDLSSLCVHTRQYGTRSCSILMKGGRAGARYWHLEGPPCEGRLATVPLPLG